MFKWMESTFGGVDVCINNCGITLKEPMLGKIQEKLTIACFQEIILKFLEELTPQQMREMLDINVVALTLCTNKAFESMSKKDGYGHIININRLIYIRPYHF